MREILRLDLRKIGKDTKATRIPSVNETKKTNKQACLLIKISMECFRYELAINRLQLHWQAYDLPTKNHQKIRHKLMLLGKRQRVKLTYLSFFCKKDRRLIKAKPIWWLVRQKRKYH